MTDLTPVFNELLKSYNAPPTADASLTLQNLDSFLKEAYRIVCHCMDYFANPQYLRALPEFAYSFTEPLP